MTDAAISIETDRGRVHLNPISERDGRIVWITLSRPERANALDSETLRQILDALDLAEGQPNVEAIVLHGAGQHFCAGADLRELHSDGPAGVRRLLNLFREVTTRSRARTWSWLPPCTAPREQEASRYPWHATSYWLADPPRSATPTCRRACCRVVATPLAFLASSAGREANG